MDATFNETAATPNLDPGDPQNAAVGDSEATRRLKRLLRAGGLDREPGGANLDTEDQPDAVVVGSEAADQEPGGATKCAYCAMAFESGDQSKLIDGQLYHRHLCASLKSGKLIGNAAE